MEGLITSKSRIGVLTLLALNPREVFYPREIAQSESLAFTAVLRELKHLSGAGLVEQLIKNGKTYYRINEHNPIYVDLKNIIIKTTGAAQVIKKQLEKAEGIKLAFIFGSYAKGKAGPKSDIDLLIVGEAGLKEVSSLLAPVKVVLKKELNYFCFTEKEIQKRLKTKDYFLKDVLKGKVLFVKGSESEFKTTFK